MRYAGIQVFALAAIAVPLATVAFAQSNPVVGLWKFVEPNSTTLIRTWEENGKLVGKVEKKLLKSGGEDNGVCSKCKGDTKDKPIAGLPILWDMVKDGEKWTGGKILEPDTGKVYSCRIESSAGGKELKVRGSFMFLSKTQTWLREE